MSDAPIGMIAAEAIEVLDSSGRPDGFVSDFTPPEPPLKREKRKRLMRKRDLRIVGTGGHVQLALTIAPLLLADLVVLSCCFTLVTYGLKLVMGIGLYVAMISQGMAGLACFVAMAGLLGLYPGTAVSPVLEFRQLVRSCWIAFGLVMLMNQCFGLLSYSELLIGLLGCAIASIALPVGRAAARIQLAKHQWWGERAVIIGSGPQGRAIYNFYRRSPQRGLRPIGVVDFERSPIEFLADEQGPALPYLGSVRRLSLLARRYKLRWGIVAPAGADSAISMNQVMKFSTDLKHLLVLPSDYLLPSLWSSSRECAGLVGVHVTDHLGNPAAAWLKKSIDLLLAAVALVLLAPLITCFVVWIKWKSPGPAFYGHERIGRGGKRFKAWKLRTMVVNASEVLEECLESCPEMRRQWKADQKLKSDPRIIPGIGHFLRTTSLDELPQLLNVLRGEMSLVGPRPIVTCEIEKYGEMYPLYLRVTPGITGLWQVSGRNNTSYEQRVRLDSYYVCNWSVWLDAYIILRTVRTLLLREGAY